MGLDYYFYCQKHTQQGWSVPADFTNEHGNPDSSGEFTWFDDQDVSIRLFLGAQALFPLHNDFPPGFEQIPLYQRNVNAFTEWFSGWLPFEELLLDCWDETLLLVSKRVTASHALLFGDGQQPFPHQALLLAGFEQLEIERLENTSYYVKYAEIVDQPIDYNSGQTRNYLERMLLFPNQLVKVSWKVTVSQFLGEWRTKEFRRIRQYGADEELRIICLFN